MFQTHEARFIPRWRTEAFDGTSLKALRQGGNEPAHLMLQPLSSSALLVVPMDLPVLMAHGLLPLDGEFDLKSLRSLVPGDVSTRLIGPGLVGGRECTVLRIASNKDGLDGRYDELYLDNADPGIVRRWSRYVDGNRIATMDIRYKTVSGYLFPSGWHGSTFTYGELGSALLHVFDLNVQRVAINTALKPQDFKISVPEGTIVHDNMEAKKRRDPLVASKNQNAIQPERSQPSLSRRIWIAVNIAVIAAFGAFFVVRRLGRLK